MSYVFRNKAELVKALRQSAAEARAQQARDLDRIEAWEAQGDETPFYEARKMRVAELRLSALVAGHVAEAYEHAARMAEGLKEG